MLSCDGWIMISRTIKSRSGRTAAVSAILWVLLMLPAARLSAGPDELVPAGASVYLEITDGKRFLSDFGRSPAFRALTESEMFNAAGAAVWNITRLAAYTSSGKALKEIYSEFFDHAALFALRRRKPNGKLDADWAFVLKVKNRDEEFQRFLTDFRTRVRTLNPKTVIQRLSCKGVTIETIRSTRGKALSHASVKGYWIAGSFQAVRGAVEVAQGHKCPITSDPAYSSSRKLMPQSGGFVYVDTELVTFRDSTVTGKAYRERQISGLSNLRAVSAGLNVSGAELVSTIVLDYGGEPVSLLRLLSKNAKADFKAFGILPEETELILTADFGSGKDALNVIRELIVRTAGRQRLEQEKQKILNLERALAVDLQTEFVNQLSGEVFVALRTPKLAESVRISRRRILDELHILFGFSVSRPGELQKTLDRTFEKLSQIDARFSLTTNLQGKVPYYVPAIPNMPFKIAYTYLDSCFVLALDEADIRKTIEAFAAGKVAARSPGLKHFIENIPRTATLRIVADPRHLLSELIKLGAIAPERMAVWSLVLRELGKTVADYKGISVAFTPVANGFRVDCRSLLGEPFILAALSGFAPFAPAHRDIPPLPALAYDNMIELRKALRRFEAREQKFPGSLQELAPFYIAEIPPDPYAKGRQIAYLLSSDKRCFMLSSVGPDGEKDIGVTPEGLPGFLRDIESSPAGRQDTEELKRMVFRFRFAVEDDEKGFDDEGDLILSGARSSGRIGER